MDAKPAAIVTIVLAVGLLATGLLATATVEQPPAAIETPMAEPTAPEQPTSPEQPREQSPAPAPNTSSSDTLPTLVEALREAYPGIAFFEGAWGDYIPAPDERVGQPGVYAGVVGVTGPKTVEFDGGTAVVTPKRFDGFKNTTELVIEVR